MENILKKVMKLSKFLHEHYKSLGRTKYLKSYVRLEHGPGKGFGGVSNTGSSDCLKEQFRNLGVKLGAKFDRIDKIFFKTDKGNSITQNNRTEDNFRVEHTMELTKDLYEMYEEEFIMTDKLESDPKKILMWIIEYHVATGIHPEEQKKGKQGKEYRQNNFQHPFKKYTAKVYYKGQDVSNYTYDQIKKINLLEHGIPNINYKTIKKEYRKDIKKFGKTKPIKQGHELPSIALAQKLYNDEIKLLNNWYIYKKNKLYNGSKWSKGLKAEKLRLRLK